MRLLLISIGFLVMSQILSAQRPYQPDWESLDTRPLPGWFNEAKFGIFVVWGPYSVPAWVDRGYAEWYAHSMRQEGSPTWEFHRRVYGPDFKYEDFTPMFRAELWDPEFWCDLFVKAGAKYVVTTSNYHDGFAMWPTEYDATENTDIWNSMDIGPRRDILGELNKAGEKRGLKMGIYYSLMEWYHPLYLTDLNRFVDEHVHPKFKEVVSNYKPWFIFLDGEWEHDYKTWKSEKLAAWLYNESPVRDYVVVNDRWGQCRGVHGDVYESEYGGGTSCSPEHPWEEDRGMGHSYGYNRSESVFDYDSAEELIRMLCLSTANGGNYLLCVGPTADGRIPVIMQERLLQIGEWLKVNGEAIYSARVSPFWPRRFEWGTVSSKPGKLFLHVHDPELTQLTLDGLNNPVQKASLFTEDGSEVLRVTQEDGEIRLQWPRHLSNEAATVIMLDIDGEPSVDRTQRQYSDGDIFFNCRGMKIHGEGAWVHYGGFADRLQIRNWTDPDEFISAGFILHHPGKYDVEITYAATADPDGSQEGWAKSLAGSEFQVEIGEHILEASSEATDGEVFFKTFAVGSVELEKTGKYTLIVRPRKGGVWHGLALQAIRISPSGGSE